MADLVIRNNHLFTVGKDRIFLLVSGNDDLNALFQIRLRSVFPAVTDCTEGSLIYNVRKLCTGCAGCHAGNLVKINIVSHFYAFCVDFQDLFPAL